MYTYMYTYIYVFGVGWRATHFGEVESSAATLHEQGDGGLLFTYTDTYIYIEREILHICLYIYI